MDNLRPQLNTGRSVFHQTHVVNANAIYELPFGHDRRWLRSGGLVDALVGGWQLASIFVWQSGSPLSITSGRASFNRAGRSNCTDPIGCNTAFTHSGRRNQRHARHLQATRRKIYSIDPKVVDTTTGRAVGADNLSNSASFNGQVFLPGSG